MTGSKRTLKGFEVYSELLCPEEQRAMVEDVRGIALVAPLFSPTTPYGKKMSVRMTSAGTFGWCSDRRGYRYERKHPAGVDWPPIPASVLSIWNRVANCARAANCCLVNYYGKGAKMGLHRDNDEADLECPVVSISLGDGALFRIGNPTRGGKTESVWLGSGDVVVMGGEARLSYHGIDRIKFGSSDLLRDGGRINLTLRVVD